MIKEELSNLELETISEKQKLIDEIAYILDMSEDISNHEVLATIIVERLKEKDNEEK